MKIQRVRFAVWVVGLAMAFGVSWLASTASASATGGSSGGATTAKAKAKAKHKTNHKKKKPTRGEKLASALKACKKDKSSKKKACEAAALKKYKLTVNKTTTKTVTVSVPGGTTSPTPTPTPTPTRRRRRRRRRHRRPRHCPNLVSDRRKPVGPRRSKRREKYRSRPHSQRNRSTLSRAATGSAARVVRPGITSRGWGKSRVQRQSAQGRLDDRTQPQR